MSSQPPFGTSQCAWCGTALTPHQSVTTKSCGAADCERRRTVELARSVTDRRAQEHEDLKATLSHRHSEEIETLLAEHGQDRDAVRIMVTPFNEGRLSVLPEARLEGLKQHLATVADEGFAVEDPETLSWPTQRRSAELPEPEVADAGCATCQGGCCRPGGPSWGFIGKEEVGRFRIANPDATAEDFQQYYLDQLPEESVTESCVFQSNTGCTLSRADRSTLCNTFLCRGVKTMLAERSRDGEAPTVVIAAERGVAYNLGFYQPGDGWTGARRIASDEDG